MSQTIHERTDEQKLAAIAYYFDLGTILSSKRAMGTNDNYAITTDKGQFLVKIIVNTTIEEIVEGLPYLQRLEAYYFPAAAYYLKAPDGSVIYQSSDCNAVVLPMLPREEPELSEQICREVGKYLALLHLLPSDGLPKKRHWLDNDYLPEAIAKAVDIFGPDKLPETLKEYRSFQHFKADMFPQSLIHGDLDTTNCLFVGEKLSAFLDWQEMGVGAALIDFAMTVIGFCFHVVDTPEDFHGTFDPRLYKSLLEGYTQVRPLTSDESANIETAIKYVGLTQPVWSIVNWEQYHSGEEMIETTRLYWCYGLDTLQLPS